MNFKLPSETLKALQGTLAQRGPFANEFHEGTNMQQSMYHNRDLSPWRNRTENEDFGRDRAEFARENARNRSARRNSQIGSCFGNVPSQSTYSLETDAYAAPRHNESIQNIINNKVFTPKFWEVGAHGNSNTDPFLNRLAHQTTTPKSKFAFGREEQHELSDFKVADNSARKTLPMVLPTSSLLTPTLNKFDRDLDHLFGRKRENEQSEDDLGLPPLLVPKIQIPTSPISQRKTRPPQLSEELPPEIKSATEFLKKLREGLDKENVPPTNPSEQDEMQLSKESKVLIENEQDFYMQTAKFSNGKQESIQGQQQQPAAYLQKEATQHPVADHLTMTLTSNTSNDLTTVQRQLVSSNLIASNLYQDQNIDNLSKPEQIHRNNHHQTSSKDRSDGHMYTLAASSPAGAQQLPPNRFGRGENVREYACGVDGSPARRESLDKLFKAVEVRKDQERVLGDIANVISNGVSQKHPGHWNVVPGVQSGSTISFQGSQNNSNGGSQTTQVVPPINIHNHSKKGSIVSTVTALWRDENSLPSGRSNEMKITDLNFNASKLGNSTKEFQHELAFGREWGNRSIPEMQGEESQSFLPRNIDLRNERGSEEVELDIPRVSKGELSLKEFEEAGESFLRQLTGEPTSVLPSASNKRLMCEPINMAFSSLPRSTNSPLRSREQSPQKLNFNHTHETYKSKTSELRLDMDLINQQLIAGYQTGSQGGLDTPVMEALNSIQGKIEELNMLMGKTQEKKANIQDARGHNLIRPGASNPLLPVLPYDRFCEQIKTHSSNQQRSAQRQSDIKIEGMTSEKKSIEKEDRAISVESISASKHIPFHDRVFEAKSVQNNYFESPQKPMVRVVNCQDKDYDFSDYKLQPVTAAIPSPSNAEPHYHFEMNSLSKVNTQPANHFSQTHTTNSIRYGKSPNKPYSVSRGDLEASTKLAEQLSRSREIMSHRRKSQMGNSAQP